MRLEDELEMLRLATVAVDSALSYSSGDVLIDAGFYFDVRLLILESLRRRGEFMPGRFRIVHVHGRGGTSEPVSLSDAVLVLIHKMEQEHSAEHWIVQVTP